MTASSAPDDDLVAYLLAYTAGLDLGPQRGAFASAGADLPPDASLEDLVLHRLGRHPDIGDEGTGPALP